jgi:ribosome-binding factor A
MQENRKARLISVIQQECSQAIAREIKDPRVKNAIISRVEVTDDGSEATLFVITSRLGAQVIPENEAEEQKLLAENQKRTQECVKGLNHAAGFLRRQLGDALNTRVIPTLIFKEDRGYENTSRVFELLKNEKF